MAIQTEPSRPWTLDDLDRLPDDGNKYEVVRGELFVTPAPSPDHERMVARLRMRLEPYVIANGLGMIYQPRSVVRFKGSEAEPDLMVRREPPANTPWDDWPIPILVVEVISPTTRRRDREQKRQFYMDAGVAEYWIVDPESRVVAVVLPGEADRNERTRLVWSPRDASDSLAIDLAPIFD